jgi:hypothetical protein
MQVSTDELQNTSSMNNEKVIRKRNRPDKKTKYANERKELIEKLNKLIGIDETKNSVYLYEMENNSNLKPEIEKLLPDIKKYYKYGNWGYFSNSESKGHDNHIALIRAIYNDSGFDVVSKHKVTTFNDIKKQYTVVAFYKK